MFCNEECQEEGMKKFHEVECEFSDKVHLSESNNESEEIFEPFDMLRFLTESLVSEKWKLHVRIFLSFILNFNFQVITQSAEKESIVSHSMLMDDVYPETLFDFDLGQKLDECLDTKRLHIVNMLESGFQESMAWIYEDTAYQLLAKYPKSKDIIKNEDEYDFLVAFIVNFMFIHKRNSSKVMGGGKVDGVGIQLFGSLLNHSCDPNVTNVSMDNKFAIVVTKPMVTYTASTGICHLVSCSS
jgi:hypothetical protein